MLSELRLERKKIIISLHNKLFGSLSASMHSIFIFLFSNARDQRLGSEDHVYEERRKEESKQERKKERKKGEKP